MLVIGITLSNLSKRTYVTKYNLSETHTESCEALKVEIITFAGDLIINIMRFHSIDCNKCEFNTID